MERVVHGIDLNSSPLGQSPKATERKKRAPRENTYENTAKNVVALEPIWLNPKRIRDRDCAERKEAA